MLVIEFMLVSWQRVRPLSMISTGFSSLSFLRKASLGVIDFKLFLSDFNCLRSYAFTIDCLTFGNNSNLSMGLSPFDFNTCLLVLILS